MFYFPEACNDSEGVRRILTQDMYFRKKKSWPLIKLEDFNSFLTLTPYAEDVVDPLMKTHALYFRLKEFNSAISTDAIQILYKTFEQLQIVMTKYAGKIAVCGGILTRVLNLNHRNSRDLEGRDVDIFFYNTNEEEATEILIDCVALITSAAAQSDKNIEVRVEHRMNITNIIVTKKEITDNEGNQGEIHYIYQFIHRVYPTLDSIIGGFDLGPCMLAFDGKYIYGTSLGAWSIAKKAIIIDNTRRSTSFEYRVIKYKSIGYDIIFPGLLLNKNIYCPCCRDSELIKSQKLSQLRQFMKVLGMSFDLEYDERPTNQRIWVSEQETIKLKSERNSTMFELTLHTYIKNDHTEPLISLGGSPVFMTLYDTLPASILNRHSDYSHLNCPTELLPLANASMLRCNNLDGVIAYISIRCGVGNKSPNLTTHGNVLTNTMANYTNIRNKFMEIVANPIIEVDISNYQKRVIEYVKSNLIDRIARSTREDISLFAEFVPQIRQCPSRHLDKFCEEIMYKLLSRIEENVNLCKQRLTGIKWIVQNPSRQWTSSINPIILNPRDFYGKHYNEFKIGLNVETESILRLIRTSKTRNLLQTINRDLFNIIIEKLVLGQKVRIAVPKPPPNQELDINNLNSVNTINKSNDRTAGVDAMAKIIAIMKAKKTQE